MENIVKHVDVSTIVATPILVKMTAKEKLLRWADLVVKKGGHPSLYHNLEYYQDSELANLRADNTSALGVAVRDAEFRSQGLGNGKDPSSINVKEVRNFFGLSTAELHEFSCDCGGALSARQQADRIIHLAGLR
jgi:hypothetical protein